MTGIEAIGETFKGARPRAMAALMRYFRDLDLAEEAFQDACLKALGSWPKNGPPRDACAWLILVGRNSGVDRLRRNARMTDLPDESAISDTDDAEGEMAERLDGRHYRDDILRLLFICCHPELPATQQIALALRIVAGLTVPQIASAFLVSEAAMEQRITRAKARIGRSALSYETPTPEERNERLGAVTTMLYLVFNEGYTIQETATRSPLCEEAIRLARLLLKLYPAEPELMGLLALMLLQHARHKARLDRNGAIVLLEHQDRSLWDGIMTGEALSLVDKAFRHRTPGPYQIQAAIAALHARALTAEETDWAEIEILYRMLERLTPSPVVTLNRAVALSKTQGSALALALVDTLSGDLDTYFYFHGLRGGLLKALGRTAEATVAFNRAIALARSPAEADHIRTHLDEMQGPAASAGQG